MAEETRDKSGRWLKGKTGNPKGRHVSKSKQLLDEQATELMGRMIESALSGDVSALTWCCNRLLPPLKPVAQPVTVTLPDGPLSEQGRAVLAELSRGTLSADECAALIGALQSQCRLIELSELLPKLEQLEAERKTP